MRPTRRQFLIASGALAASASVAGFPALASPPTLLPDEDGSMLWLRHQRVAHPGRLREYRGIVKHLVVLGDAPQLRNAKTELEHALPSLLDQPIGAGPADAHGVVVVGTLAHPLVRRILGRRADEVGPEGYAIVSEGRGANTRRIVVAGRTPTGALRGVYGFLRLLTTHQRLMKLEIVENPATPLRMANHWDNWDGSVERGYAGSSIFGFTSLPQLAERHTNYCRMLASLGMNASVINNVNASPNFLSSDFLESVVPLADLMRSYGITLYLSANYASPMSLTRGTRAPIETADPFDEEVQAWWRDKVAEIYTLIPDFGGFLVKANSEGQPGPLDYGRTHADGANLLARAVAPYDGTVVWRTFTHSSFADWAEYQYKVFAPLDGEFEPNAVVQTKHGPIDFQVREPVHPLFHALGNTQQMLELQLTQEYTGHDVHAVYLAPMWKEVLDFTTAGPGAGPTVADIVTGGTRPGPAGIAGVMNIGDDVDWTGYQFGAANTYAFGQMCWNPSADPETLARQWTQMTFRPAPDGFVDEVTSILMRSRAAYEDYTSPLGLGYFTNPGGSHFDPGPAITNTQSHFSTPTGTGFDRTVATGTGYTGLYPEAWTEVYEHLASCPDELLLFMHWVPYEHRLHSGSTVIEHIYRTHFEGHEEALAFRDTWQRIGRRIDGERYADILTSFEAQESHARLWRDEVVMFYFGLSRILSESRSWLQVRTHTDLLLGGWPNLIRADVTNATASEQALQVGLRVPGGWTADEVGSAIASTGTDTVAIPVTPPLEAALTDVAVTVNRDIEVLGAASRVFVVPAGQRCHLALDAGTSSSAVLPGYTQLSERSMWHDDAVAGWVGAASSSRDRGGNALVRDFVGHTEPRTLRFLAPAGVNTVHLLVGDMGPDAEATRFHVDGVEVASTPWQRGGSATWTSFQLDGGPTGRTVDMRMTSDGGWWRLNALAIPDPAAPMPELVVLDATAPEVWWSGQETLVSVPVANMSAEQTSVLVTGTAPEGWVVSPVTVTVPAGETVDAELPVTTPPEPQLGRVSLRVTAGDGTLVEEGRTVLGVTTIAPDAAYLALDGGTDSSPVVEGYQSLAPNSAWDEQAGFGWVGELPISRDRGGNPLLRDFVLGRDRTYTLRVRLPSGRRRVWALTGDGGSASGITTISENGVELARSGNGEIGGGQYVWFSLELDGGPSGRIADLELTGSLREGYWRLGALIIE